MPQMFANFGIEVVYSLLILILCLVVFYKTKDLYDLTEHKGIKYFRLAFLFFGISYLLRIALSLVIVYSDLVTGFGFQRQMNELYVLIPFAYFSFLAIISLTYSLVWNRIKLGKLNEAVFMNILSVILLLSVLFGHLAFFQVQLIIVILCFVIIIILSEKKHKKKHHFSKLKISYILLLVFWVLNMWIFSLIIFIQAKLTLYIISLLLFIYLTIHIIIKTGLKK